MEFEKDIEKYLIKQIKMRGGKCIKLSSQHEEGLPDRMVLLPGGGVFFVELKRKNGKLSPMQEVQHRFFKKLGMRVYVPFVKDDVDTLLYEEGGGV